MTNPVQTAAQPSPRSPVRSPAQSAKPKKKAKKELSPTAVALTLSVMAAVIVTVAGLFVLAPLWVAIVMAVLAAAALAAFLLRRVVKRLWSRSGKGRRAGQKGSQRATRLLSRFRRAGASPGGGSRSGGRWGRSRGGRGQGAGSRPGGSPGSRVRSALRSGARKVPGVAKAMDRRAARKDGAANNPQGSRKERARARMREAARKASSRFRGKSSPTSKSSPSSPVRKGRMPGLVRKAFRASPPAVRSAARKAVRKASGKAVRKTSGRSPQSRPERDQPKGRLWSDRPVQASPDVPINRVKPQARTDRPTDKPVVTRPSVRDSNPIIPSVPVVPQRPAGSATPVSFSASRGAGPMDPFAEPTDAVTSAAARFEVTNAKGARDWFNGAERFEEAQAAAWSLQAQKLTEGIPLDPDVAELAREVASSHSKSAELAGLASAAFDMCHREDMQKIDEPLPNEELWDISMNRD